MSPRRPRSSGTRTGPLGEMGASRAALGRWAFEDSGKGNGKGRELGVARTGGCVDGTRRRLSTSPGVNGKMERGGGDTEPAEGRGETRPDGREAGKPAPHVEASGETPAHACPGGLALRAPTKELERPTVPGDTFCAFGRRALCPTGHCKRRQGKHRIRLREN